jgi:hypothetical protein
MLVLANEGWCPGRDGVAESQSFVTLIRVDPVMMQAGSPKITLRPPGFRQGGGPRRGGPAQAFRLTCGPDLHYPQFRLVSGDATGGGAGARRPASRE